MVVNLPHGIALRGDHLPLPNQHRSKGQTEQDVFFLHKLLKFLPAAVVLPAAKQQVAVFVHIAGVHQAVVDPAHQPVIHQGSGLPVVVKITAGSHHCVDALRHFRGDEQLLRPKFSPGQKPAELGRVGNFDFREGVNAPINGLLPGDGQNGLVQVAADSRPRQKGDVPAEKERLPV